jgi:TP901 family phage tail tape measure protein
MYRLQYFFSIFTVYRTLSKQIRQTYNDLQNLDKAFGSIAMVTSKTVNDLWASYSQYADIANRLGQTTESAIKTSALFYQQGLDTADVLKLTESTMKLATLAGQDFETSTKQLTAALRAFHMEMEQGEHVTDVYSELAAHAAADVSGIADAMSKVASIASSAGASFENISAFLTQIIETTQEGGVNAGTALKTIIARFTELKENVDDAEESFEDLDYNKIDKALKTVGINLKDDAGQIRNFDDIIIELSGIWDTLSRNQ